MRRATLLAVVLVLAIGGTVQATARFATVTGSYEYQLFGSTRAVQLDAHAGDPATGSFSYVSPFATIGGPVTCVRVIGLDAWVAGPITAGTAPPEFDGWAVHVRDGGTLRSDMAITYVDTLQGVLDLCQAAKHPRQVGDMVPVTAGNISIHVAP